MDPIRGLQYATLALILAGAFFLWVWLRKPPPPKIYERNPFDFDPDDDYQ